MDEKNIIVETENETEAKPELSLGQKVLRAFERFGDLFVLNICFFVSCIPIVTIGAAFTALYTMTNRMIDSTEGSIVKYYFKAFRENLKQGLVIWIIDVLVFALVISGYLRYVSIVVFFLACLAIPLQFPLLARYENSAFRIMTNSFLLAIAHPGAWFKLFFIWMLPVVLYYFYPRLIFTTWYIWGMGLSAIFAYICSGFLKDFYLTIEEEERSKEGEKENEQDSSD
ncbi:MAG: YesL family protein [Lachnospiraceae bacterium]|nr:YesL family protein [Lachnospiraceae bacterium]